MHNIRGFRFKKHMDIQLLHCHFWALARNMRFSVQSSVLNSYIGLSKQSPATYVRKLRKPIFIYYISGDLGNLTRFQDQVKWCSLEQGWNLFSLGTRDNCSYDAVSAFGQVFSFFLFFFSRDFVVRGIGLRPKKCRPMADTKKSRCTRQKKT